MADQLIQVPGVGLVAFPDTMTDEAISTAAAKLFSEWQAEQQVRNAALAKTSAVPTQEEQRGFGSYFAEGATAPGTYLAEGPGRVLGGLKTAVRGKLKHGAADVVRGLGISALPFAPAAVAAAPAAMLGGLSLGVLGDQGARLAGADDDTATLVGAGLGLAGGVGAGARLPGALPGTNIPLAQAAGKGLRLALSPRRAALRLANRLDPAPAKIPAAPHRGVPDTPAAPLPGAAMPEGLPPVSEIPTVPSANRTGVEPPPRVVPEEFAGSPWKPPVRSASNRRAPGPTVDERMANPQLATPPLRVPDVTAGEALPPAMPGASPQDALAYELMQRLGTPETAPAGPARLPRASRSGEARNVVAELDELDVETLGTLLTDPLADPRLLPLIRRVYRAKGGVE